MRKSAMPNASIFKHNYKKHKVKSSKTCPTCKGDGGGVEGPDCKTCGGSGLLVTFEEETPKVAAKKKKKK